MYRGLHALVTVVACVGVRDGTPCQSLWALGGGQVSARGRGQGAAHADTECELRGVFLVVCSVFEHYSAVGLDGFNVIINMYIGVEVR
jgi:hypothetical protein